MKSQEIVVFEIRTADLPPVTPRYERTLVLLSGAARYRAFSQEWALPAGSGITVPIGAPLNVELYGDLAAFLVVTADERERTERRPRALRAIAVDAVTRELLLQGREDEQVVQAILRAPSVQPCILRWPMVEERIERLCRNIFHDIESRHEQSYWAESIGVSIRWVEHWMRAETGGTFAQWRTTARVFAALPLLGSGFPVSDVARAVGYRQASRFSEMFRQRTGRTPRGFFAWPDRVPRAAPRYR